MMQSAPVAPAEGALNALNAFQYERALRLYQLQMAQTGSFTLPCPVTGTPVRPIANYLKPGHAILYLFEGTVPFVAVAGSLKDGFPLVDIVRRDALEMASRPHDPALRKLALILLETPRPPRIDRNRPTIIPIGHPNFAHFLWNEWPALRALSDLPSKAAIHPAQDPLGLLSLARLPRSEEAVTEGWSRTPITFMGSDRCSRGDMAEARRLLKIGNGPGGPNVWITIRDRGRTAENQVALLSAIIRKLHQHHPHLRFLLDGFSLPARRDGRGDRRLQEAFAARICGGQAIAKQIIQALPHIPITDRTGIPLHEALKEIATCQFYVSHAGTMQHKAAWLSGLPGIIHGNQSSIVPGALRWCAEMAEGSLTPAALSPDIVQDLQVRDMPNQTDRNKDYRITNVERAADEVLAYFEGSVTRQRAG